MSLFVYVSFVLQTQTLTCQFSQLISESLTLMAQVLRCCSAQSSNEPYIGVDQKCTQPAIFCIEHSPHKNTEGLMHQMLPLKHFKKTLQQKKFMMNEKIGLLIDQYNNLMDSLIEQIRELKLRKNIELSMLWLRQLARDEQEYELMRQIYRMDFKDLTCALVHSIYFKIVHNQVLEKKKVNQINCYKGIAEILDHLSQERQTRSFLSKKIAEIEGILENGEILKRALPEKLVLKQSIKEVLLQCHEQDFVSIKYNKCIMTRNSRQYISIFSKYPIVHNAVYHINFSTKYTNVMLGVCTQALIDGSRNKNRGMENSEYEQSAMSNQSSLVTEFDRHYSKDSLVFNCTNGCVYKEGMFESGSSALTKGLKELALKMRITSTNELIILFGKNVLCRQNLDTLANRNQFEGQTNKFYLHVLLRTEGDSFDVDRDKDVSGDELPSKASPVANQPSDLKDREFFPINPRQNINFDEIKRRNEEEVINVNNLKDEILSAAKLKQAESLPAKQPQSQFSSDFRHLSSSKLLAQLNFQSGKSLKSQQQGQKARQQAVRKEVKKLQDKRNQSQEPKAIPSYKNLDEIQKQQKINQIIKRERIDKILNDLKSKPVYSSDSRAEPKNTIVARKLKQIQDRKAASKGPGEGTQFVHGNRQNVHSSKYQRPSYNQNDEYNQKNLIILKPITVQNNLQQLNESSYALTNPKKKAFNEAQQQFGQKGMKQLRPSQKIFQFNSNYQDQQFESTPFRNEQTNMNGNVTPIDRINDFQFDKKSPKLNHQKHQQRFSFGTNQNPSNSFQPSFNDESNHLMETFDVKSYQRVNSPNWSISEGLTKPITLVMPQLKESHFSKMTLQQGQGNMEESFAPRQDKRLKTDQAKKKEVFLQVKNPMKQKKMDETDSVIDIEIRSDGKSESFHIGEIISPQPRLGTSKQNNRKESLFDHSFDRISQKELHKDQSIINIRGTDLGL